MADNCDRATELAQLSLDAALARQAFNARPAIHDECIDCGNEIPAARRQAAPWATTCIDCQGIREQQARHRR